MGFYLRKNPGLKKPIICVNTAHHQTAIGAAFAHEMGHHLTAEMFGARAEPQLLLYTGYAEHLEDPPELAADVLVSLGVFPEKVARLAFGRSSAGPEGGNTSMEGGHFELTQMLEYFAVRYGLRFDERIPISNRLQYLAGMIHYTKLRQAILEEYDL